MLFNGGCLDGIAASPTRDTADGDAFQHTRAAASRVSVFLVTLACMLAYVPLVVRLNNVGGDVRLLDMHSLSSGAKDLRDRATEPNHMFSRRSVAHESVVFVLQAAYLVLGPLFEHSRPLLALLGWTLISLSLYIVTCAWPPYHKQARGVPLLSCRWLVQPT